MSTTFTTILGIITVCASLSSLAVTLFNATKESVKLKKFRKYPPKNLVIENKSGKVIVLELEKQNDTQQLIRTMDALLGK
ncbi:hypothetical protein SAMN05518672_110148 [Chitinophaga sp. CF118]|uniref:hypothetical protein n=1 Tax=Chitinophaga sp. CF118 TaxID=1884367 RepID=UPI0008EB7826|nr:hypothetical protein [Chitinophaga sp. CF118]SFE80502.1 hypothetical protein SAMN05518672_110148 [Chitinophaga sp. CF118]